MTPRRLARFAYVGAVAVAGLMSTPAGTARAEACPDVEVVFARGTGEPPGVGAVGQAFVDALRAKTGTRTVNVYGVQYPATIDFPRAVDGINDASAHIQATAATCPKTKIVLGGYSQGAAVAGFVTAAVVPPGALDYAGSGPMPPAVADHVAAVALFGKPAPRFLGMIGQPDVVIGPLYAAKTLDSCVPGDPICSDGGDYSLHDQYIADGLTDQAADFTASKLAPATKQRNRAPATQVAPPPPPADGSPPAPPTPPVEAAGGG